MDKTLCKQFDTLRNYLPDELEKHKPVNFNQNENIKYYCSNGESKETECKTDLDQIKAGCLWLFEQLFVINKKRNISIVEYIIIWLSYKLNQKKYDEINNLNDFYNKYIENNTHYTSCNNDSGDCSKQLQDNMGYPNYKKIIDVRKNLLSTNIKNMSKIYDAFKLLCNVYTELGGSNTENKTYLENASKFVKKYNELNDNSDNTEDDAYYQVLSTLSNDYINLKQYCDSNSIDCNNIPPLTSSETEENGMESSEKICYDTPSFSIVKKLILALLIFSAISIFFGIFFKCSLFVLRKRAQKQYLREKLKK
ncbi:PIR protein [Plasmodium yoelii]|uniref:PIR protein n=2 Tax=Plasmodium yoelii TaxID=5861 RepID=A0AAF0B0A7_PLAYO|nr:PIR protein [Plasmodium yoelii]WBY57657.1 PIR protein [Plasmodium yoelii yoelii]VTZ78675.1 PIR protein [Plasmodium yoelii]|eukprot:XP_022811052.1 PIR protein [Plasmodium yoelii]